MTPLAGLDASFLHLETAEMPMHAGVLYLLEWPVAELADAANSSDSPDTLAGLRAHIASRLPLLPMLRRRLSAVPLNLTNPGWVDANPDLEAHIVGVQLPADSSMAVLEARVALLHAQLLERSRPLWKFTLFEGLEAGPAGQRRVALYTQLHHAAADGPAAAAMAELLLDPSTQPRELRLPPVQAQQVARLPAGVAGQLSTALAQQWQQTLQMAKALPAAASTLGAMAAKTAAGLAGNTLQDWLAEARGEPAKERVSQVALAPRTRLNVSLSARRSFSTVSLPLAELDRLRGVHRASLDEALLFICAGALRRYFVKHGPLPSSSLVAALPVSVAEGTVGAVDAGTQASISLLSLGTQLTDPAQRLAHLLSASATARRQRATVEALLPNDFPSLGLPWLLQAGAVLYGRLHAAEKLPALANLLISIVPGPGAGPSPGHRMPLYLAGARLLAHYPVASIVHGLALHISAQSTADTLDIGLLACGQALPETAELAAYMETAFLEFQLLSIASPVPIRKPGRATAVALKSAKKRPGTKPRPSSG